MKMRLIIIFLLFLTKVNAQHADISVYPNANTITVSLERLAGPFGFYAGAFYRMGVYSYNRYATRPAFTYLNRLGVNVGLRNSGIVVGAGSTIDMSGPDPVFSPNVNVKLHPVMLLSKKPQKIDLSVSADLSNQLTFGFGIVLPLELIYW